MTCFTRLVVERVVRRRLQRVLRQAGGGEDAAYSLDVEGLARVRPAGKREQLRLQGQAGLDHGQRLQRLVARARKDRSLRVTGGSAHRPVGVQGDPRPVVVTLHEPGADDLGDDDGSNHARDGIRPSGLARLPGARTAVLPQPSRAGRSGAAAHRRTRPPHHVRRLRPGHHPGPPGRAGRRPRRSSWSTPRASRSRLVHRRVPQPPRHARLRPLPAAAPHPGPGARAVRRRADRPCRSAADRTGPRARSGPPGPPPSCCSP